MNTLTVIQQATMFHIQSLSDCVKEKNSKAGTLFSVVHEHYKNSYAEKDIT